jgi:putative copper export protein
MVNKLTVLTTIHILAAALWVGGAFALNVAMALAARDEEPATKIAAFRFASVLGPKVLAPLGLVVLGSGIWLTSDYYDFGYLWVTLGLIGAITALTVGLAYLGPKGAQALRAMQEGAGPPPPGARNWAPLVGQLNLLLITAVLVIMVIKPT